MIKKIKILSCISTLLAITLVFQNCGDGMKAGYTDGSSVGPIPGEVTGGFSENWPNQTTTKIGSVFIASSLVSLDLNNDGIGEVIFLTSDISEEDQSSLTFRIVDGEDYHEIQNFDDQSTIPSPNNYSFFVIDLDQDGSDEIFYLAKDQKTVATLSIGQASDGSVSLGAIISIVVDELEDYIASLNNKDSLAFGISEDSSYGQIVTLGAFGFAFDDSRNLVLIDLLADQSD